MAKFHIFFCFGLLDIKICMARSQQENELRNIPYGLLLDNVLSVLHLNVVMSIELDQLIYVLVLTGPSTPATEDSGGPSEKVF